MFAQLRATALGIGLACVAASAASSATYTVRQDGTGDFLTLGAAVAFASDGDAIEVGPGTYVEAVELINKNLGIYSVAGPSSTILDGGGALQILNYKDSGGTIDGFTLRDGWYTGGGGAATILFSGTLLVTNCVFEDNNAGFQGGACSIGGAGIQLTFSNCAFDNNFAPAYGGAVVVINGATVTFDDCSFTGNSANSSAGALDTNGSTVNIYNCLFEDNVSVDGAGAVRYYFTTGSATNNTFYNNTSAIRATVVCSGSQYLTFDRNILAGDTQGHGLQIIGSPPSHSCNVFWQNADGPIVGDTLEPDEIVSDPLFCSSMTGNFFLDAASPAAAPNSLCNALIGAYPVGCGTVPTERATWGGIKAIFGDTDS